MIDLDTLKSDPQDLIELLRCSADLIVSGRSRVTPVSEAANMLYGAELFERPAAQQHIGSEVLDLRFPVLRQLFSNTPIEPEHRVVAMLELAQRIEDAVIRRDAILICDIAASQTKDRGFQCYSDIARDLDISRIDWPDALRLALQAYSELGPKHNHAWTQERDAEAAQMLREGWTP